MNFSQGNLAGVWSIPTRTLTGFGGAAVITTQQNQTIAASATANFLLGTANQLTETEITVKAGAAGAITIQAFDGTNTFNVATVAAAGIDRRIIYQTSTVGSKYVNGDAANSVVFMTNNIRWVT
jgi:hypothetical protein